MHVRYTRVIYKAEYRLMTFLLGHCLTTSISLPLKCVVLWERAAGQLNSKMFVAVFLKTNAVKKPSTVMKSY